MADLPAPVATAAVCASCSCPPDAAGGFRLVPRGSGYAYKFRCEGAAQGCKGDVVVGYEDFLSLVKTSEAGKGAKILAGLEEAFDRMILDVKDVEKNDVTERASATNAAVAVAKVKLQVAGILQGKSDSKVLIQNQMVANFDPNGAVALELLKKAQARFGDDLQKAVRQAELVPPEPVAAAPEVSEEEVLG